MISRFVSLSPASGSVLAAQSLEPGSDSVSPFLSLPLPHSCSVSLSLRNKHKKKIKKKKEVYLPLMVITRINHKKYPCLLCFWLQGTAKPSYCDLKKEGCIFLAQQDIRSRQLPDQLKGSTIHLAFFPFTVTRRLPLPHGQNSQDRRLHILLLKTARSTRPRYTSLARAGSRDRPCCPSNFP